MSKDEILWSQKYRPKTVADCVLPEDIKKTFQEFVDNATIPSLLLSGSQGCGKTTVAKALCQEVGVDYIVINGSDENGIDVLRGKIKSYASSVSLSGGRKVVIIDESDYLSQNCMPALRGVMEEFSKNCSFILTCNYKNRIIEPIHSRCAVIEFKIPKEENLKLRSQFFKRVCLILDQESIEYNKEVIAKVVGKYYPDNRRILNELQRYGMSGSIDTGILAQVSDIKLTPLVKCLREKNFADTRKWLSDNEDIDCNTLFRKFYDHMYDFLVPNSIPHLVLLIAKYQYQSAFVADQQINMMALFTEMMIEMEFK
jgi:DNA polymerase III delta prime subunit